MSTATTYIKTEKQLVPALRFKEFDRDWNETSLEDVIQILSGFAFKSSYFSEVGQPLLTPKNFTKDGRAKFNDRNTKFTTEIVDEKYLCKSGDLLVLLTDLTPSCELLGKPVVLTDSDGEVLLNQRIIKITADNTKISKDFLSNVFLTETYHRRIKDTATGTTVRHSSNKIIYAYKTGLPSLPEQQKIASFLSAVDEKIQQLTKNKILLEEYKKGVMQQLFSGELRFKDEIGNTYPDWESRKMSEVLFEHKLNSTGSEVVFSVSVHKGLVNQVEHLGRVFAAKNTDNYNLVQPGDIVYTKSPTGSFPLGIIKQSKIDKNVIVSPLYGVFTPETEGLGYMFNVFFESPINVKNYLASIIQKGAKNTINITNTTFLSKKMKLPVSKEEQNKIGDFLKEIDAKIAKTKNQITQTQTFKKGLLQQMFI